MRNDVGVLIIFFNKVETLEKVFLEVRAAKPSKLFLAQDGARVNNDRDVDNIVACRKIVENIDWKCEVYKNYSEKNLTCDPRVFSAISWAFESVEKLIILEDDSVPNQSFFKFMDEMLERFAYDDRIQMISGIERLGQNKHCSESYYFSTINAGCAWATWKRVWKDVEKYADCRFVNDMTKMKKVNDYVKKCMPKCYHDFVQRGKDNLRNNEEIKDIFSWEYAVATSMVLEHRLAITPRVNLVKNIGVVAEATHSGNSLSIMPKKIRRLFFMDTHELDFPLVHPQHIVRDVEYEKEYEKEFCFNSLQKLCMMLERSWLIIRKDGFSSFVRLVIKKWRK